MLLSSSSVDQPLIILCFVLSYVVRNKFLMLEELLAMNVSGEDKGNGVH